MKKIIAVFSMVAGLSGISHALSSYNVPISYVSTDRSTGKTVLTVTPTGSPFDVCNSLLQVVNSDQVSVLLTAKSTGTSLHYISFTQITPVTIGPVTVGCQVEYVEL